MEGAAFSRFSTRYAPRLNIDGPGTCSYCMPVQMTEENSSMCPCVLLVRHLDTFQIYYDLYTAIYQHRMLLLSNEWRTCAIFYEISTAFPIPYMVMASMLHICSGTLGPKSENCEKPLGAYPDAYPVTYLGAYPATYLVALTMLTGTQ